MDTSAEFFYQLGGYAAKLTHVFGAIIWIGGVLFMGGVATPILKYYNQPEHTDSSVGHVVELLEQRLIGFNWMGLWSSFMSGIVLLVLSPQFTLFGLESLYDWVIHAKMFLFLPIITVNLTLGASYRELVSARETLATGEDLSPRQITEWRIISLRRLNVYLAFLIIMLVAML